MTAHALLAEPPGPQLPHRIEMSSNDDFEYAPVGELKSQLHGD